MTGLLRWLRRRTVVQAPELPPLAEREMQVALLVPDEHPLWRSVLQCIDVQRAKCVAETIAPENQGQPQATYYAGAAQHLDELKAFLIDQRERGKRRDP